MLKARVGNTSQLVTVGECCTLYGLKSENRGIHLFCPLCHQPVFMYGANSMNVTARFHHLEGAEECSFSNNLGARYSWLIPRDVDIEGGKRLKESVFEKENLRQIYAFCHYLLRKQPFPTEKFCKLIKLADRRNIWVYRDLPFWAVGYILMTLCDFEGARNDGTKYIYRFVLGEDRPKTIEGLWENEGRYNLHKVFDGGKIMDYPPGNPYEVSEENFYRFSSNNGWIEERHINSLRKCAL